MNATISYQIPQDIARLSHPDHKIDPPEEIPPDVLDGFCHHIGYLRAEHPERIPEYRQRLVEMIDELRQRGQDAETQRLSAFLALLEATV